MASYRIENLVGGHPRMADEINLEKAVAGESIDDR